MQVVAQMGLAQWLFAVLIIIVCCFLILVILVQRGRGGGLAGAFGGAGGSSAFGAKTGDVFTWITVVVAVVYLALASVGNFVLDRSPEARATPPSDTAAPAESTEPSADDQSAPLPAPATGGEAKESAPPSDVVPSALGGSGAAGTDTDAAKETGAADRTDVGGDETGSDVTDKPTAPMPDDAGGEPSTPTEGGSEDQPNP